MLRFLCAHLLLLTLNLSVKVLVHSLALFTLSLSVKVLVYLVAPVGTQS